ncbi:Hpt domain-containing protein [Thalassospira sp.]|uniref:Hpt domain-containing protein n=1 Tax=Thalassospira sp. TaxID=1912094 RepID=UPI001B1561F2|nr:Hpt domain-containing protein [Thalassospira sp.]MBO6809116.1 Hpt domain-containing protein [Thalassospira sp.]MBO6841076.1 Hpt domain-containing protein [Thalassospira sp.]
MELIDTARFKELCDALGKDQVLLLVNLLPASYEEEKVLLISAADNKDIEGVHRSAHAIKGMARNMAAHQLAEMALALESFDGHFGDPLYDRIKQLDQSVNDTLAAMQEFLATK